MIRETISIVSAVAFAALLIWLSIAIAAGIRRWRDK